MENNIRDNRKGINKEIKMENKKNMEDSGVVLNQSNIDFLKQASMDCGSIEPGMTEEEMLYGKISVYTQTEENFNKSQLLQSEVIRLREELSSLEKLYNDTEESTRKGLIKIHESCKRKISKIREQEDIIKSLTHQLEVKEKVIDYKKTDYKKHIIKKEETVNKTQSDSLEYLKDLEELLRIIKVKDNMIQMLREENEELKKQTDKFNSDVKEYIKEKEEIFKATQCDLLTNTNSLKKLLCDKELLLKEKEILIQTLRAEQEELKKQIINFTSDVNEKVEIAKIIDEKEKEITEYKMKITENEDLYNTTQKELIRKIYELTDKIRDKELELHDKEKENNSQRKELEEEKNNTNKIFCGVNNEDMKGENKLNIRTPIMSIDNKDLVIVDYTKYTNEKDEKEEIINISQSDILEIKNSLEELSNVIKEKDTMIQALRVGLEDTQKQLNKLTSEVEEYINEKEGKFKIIQSDLLNNINGLKELLSNKELLITEKGIWKQFLREEQEETKKQINKYEMKISEKEILYNTNQKELMNKINELKEMLRGQGLVLYEKEKEINSLRVELEETKNNTNKSFCGVINEELVEDRNLNISTPIID